MLTYKIHILRHGLTQANLEGRYIGRSDPPLCEQGRAQLRELAAGCEYPSVQRLSLIHISEPTRQAEISYAVFCLKKKNQYTSQNPRD